MSFDVGPEVRPADAGAGASEQRPGPRSADPGTDPGNEPPTPPKRGGTKPNLRRIK
jgi:hypothetical protein